MKKVLKILISGLILTVMILMNPVSALALQNDQTDTVGDKGQTRVETSEFRAVWFSFKDWQKYLKGKNEQEFKAAFSSVCENSQKQGLNTIIVHVRSHNDAAYPSSCYPWSDEMTGGNPGYDPLLIITDTAHAYGLKVHAWINPYGYRNGSYSGDQSLATKDNIISGIKEILDKYPVDGIHFDDYFPPLGASVHNELLKQVCATVRGYGKAFGVSPQGNIDNNIASGADIYTWMSSNEYMDYICPQIYWSDIYGKNGDVTMYSDRLSSWISLNKAKIDMYIGLAAYRVGENSKSDLGWSRKNDNLSTQITKLRNSGCQGYILFSYSSIVSPACQEEMQSVRNVNNQQ